jgi:transcriptional repressor of cell division inhibition gene dicB
MTLSVVYNSAMTKTEALALFGGGRKAIRLCAEALTISTQAVYDWPEEQIPLLREYQLRERTNGKSAPSNSRDARKRRA